MDFLWQTGWNLAVSKAWPLLATTSAWQRYRFWPFSDTGRCGGSAADMVETMHSAYCEYSILGAKHDK